MTNNEPNQQQYPQNYPPYEDEIKLIDYLRVLWKWKWLIIAGTLVCGIVAAVISLQMPKIYEVSMVIGPGIYGVKDDGSFIYIDSVANISGKINEGIYNRKIEETLHLDTLKTGVKFKSVIPKSTNVVKLTSQWEEKDTGLGIKVTGQMIHLLFDDYGKIVEQRKGNYDKQVLIKQNNVKKYEIRKQSLIKTLEDTRHKIEGLKREVDTIKNNTDDLITQRNSLLRKGKTGVEIPLLSYSMSIQQNVFHLNQINNQIYDFREKEKKGVQQEIETLEKDIDTAKVEITGLNANKRFIRNIKVIQEPDVSLYPVKPKKKQIVLLSVVVGLFFMIFLAFFIEYIKNATSSTKQK